MTDHNVTKEYNEALRKLTTTDAVHAEVLNPLFSQLINNDAAISSSLADTAKKVGGIVNIKEFGAKGDGTDATLAMQEAGSSGKVVRFNAGTYLLSDAVTLEPNTSFVGEPGVRILINTNIDAFKFTYNNLFEDFNIDVDYVGYDKNVFEVSSATMEHLPSNQQACLYIRIRRIRGDFPNSSNTVLGTMFHFWVAKQHPITGVNYKFTGFWNIHIEDIFVKGYLGYFCRNWCYDPTGTLNPEFWMNGITFENVNIFSTTYGFFGSYDESTMLDSRYGDAGLTLINCKMQEWHSKYFYYFTNGSKYITANLTWDFMTGIATGMLYRPELQNGYPYKIYLDGDYGRLGTQTDLLGFSGTQDEKFKYIESSFAHYSDLKWGIYKPPVTPLVQSGQYGMTGGQTVPYWLKMGEISNPSSSRITGHFRLHTAYELGSRGYGMVDVSLVINDSANTVDNKTVSVTVLVSPFVPENKLGKFYVRKSFVDGKVKYEVFAKIETNLLAGVGLVSYTSLKDISLNVPFTATLVSEPTDVLTLILGNYKNNILSVPETTTLNPDALPGAVTFINSSSSLRLMTSSGWKRLPKVESGVTSSRPTDVGVGESYFDTTLGRPVWYKGSNVWVDANGTTV